jgi:hypothetical protein
MPDVAAALAKIEQANKNDLALLRESTVPSIAAAMLQLRADLLAVARKPRDARFSQQGVAQEIGQELAAARAKCNAALDSADTGAKQAISNIRADLESRTNPKLDTSEQLLQEMKKAAARRQLDLMMSASVQTEDQIASLASRGDAVALGCLRQDLELGLLTSQLSKDTLLGLLDQNEAPLLSAMETAKRQIEAEFATGLANLATSFGLARREAIGASQTSGGTLVGPSAVIANWAGGGYPVGVRTPDGGLSLPPTPMPSGATTTSNTPAGLSAANNRPAPEAGNPYS